MVEVSMNGWVMFQKKKLANEGADSRLRVIVLNAESQGVLAGVPLLLLFSAAAAAAALLLLLLLLLLCCAAAEFLCDV